jgi:valyl-tRNA synthetase
VYISSEKFEIGRNFGTKMWNAARFMQMHSEGWYLEAVKDTLYGTDQARKEQVLKIMHFVFSNALRLLHPIMPFLTEELWHDMGYAPAADTFIMHSPWPVSLSESLTRWGIDAAVVQYVDDKHELIRAGRMLRADYQISTAKKAGFIVKPADDTAASMLGGDLASLQSLLRSEEIRIEKDFEPESAMPSGICRLGVLYMPLQGLVDVEVEKKRLDAQLTQISADLERVNAKLMNLDFIKKAKREIVEQQEARKKELTESGDKLKSILETLSRM